MVLLTTAAVMEVKLGRLRVDYYREHKLLDPCLVQVRNHRITLSTLAPMNLIIINLRVNVSLAADGFIQGYHVLRLELLHYFIVDLS